MVEQHSHTVLVRGSNPLIGILMVYSGGAKAAVINTFILTEQYHPGGHTGSFPGLKGSIPLDCTIGRRKKS